MGASLVVEKEKTCFGIEDAIVLAILLIILIYCLNIQQQKIFIFIALIKSYHHKYKLFGFQLISSLFC